MLDKSKFDPLIFALLLLPMIWHMPPGPDAFLYHFAAQDWIRSGQSLIGMAHENSRFGFDSLEETIAAFITGRVAQWGFFTLLLWFLSRSPFGAITLLGIIINPLYIVIGQASTDTPAGIMFAIAFLLSLEGSAHAGWLSVVSFMLKPFNALLLLWTRPRSLVAIGLSLAWLAHGVVVSGCAVYPLSFTCLPVPWAVDTAANDADWVTAWARDPLSGLDSLHSWSWITGWWLPHYWTFCLFEVVTIGLCIIVNKFYGIKYGKKDVMPLLFILGCLAVWFVTAPSPRFATGMFMVLPAVTTLAFLGKHNLPNWTKWLPYICAFRLGMLY